MPTDSRSAEQRIDRLSVDRRGWNYSRRPPEGGDCRKLVWLEEDGMSWVGLRAFDFRGEGRWTSNGEPERAKVLCWQDLPKRPLRFWDRGKLIEVERDDE